MPSEADAPSPSSQQPQIVLLREGTDTSQGKGQLISNINACMAVVDSVRTTLVCPRVGSPFADPPVVSKPPPS